MRLFLRVAVWVCAIVPCAGSLAAQPLIRSVLVIDEADPVRPAYYPRNFAFRSTLNKGLATPVAIYTENLDLSRFANPQFDAIVGTYFREKYREKSIDLIVANGSRALELVLRLRGTLWPGVPVVFSTIEEVTAAGLKLPSDVTGTLLRRTLADAFTTARALVPQLKRIAMVGDPPELQPFQRPYTKEFPAIAAQLELIDLTGLPMRDLTARVSALPPDTAIIYEGIWSGVTAADESPEAALATIAAVANRPIVVDTEVWFGFGAAGGFLVRPALEGELVAQIAARILNGESIAKIPVTIGNVNKPVFDWRQLKRFGVSTSSLPAGSEIRFREPSMWEQYRSEFLGVFAALLLQAALIAWLIVEHRRRQLAEIRARNSMAELTHMNRVATAGELSASIAHEVNQPLAAIVARAGAARNWLAAQPPNLEKARAALDQIVTSGHRAGEVITSLRSMFRKDAKDRHQVDINKLIEAVLALVDIDLHKHRVDLETNLGDQLPPVLGNHVQLQQVILNLVMNAIDSMRSVQRRVLSVRSGSNGRDRVHVSVEDTGTGIDPSVQDQIFKPLYTTKEHGMGMGLSICQTIIERHDGRIWVSSAASGGSIFQFELPVTITKT